MFEYCETCANKKNGSCIFDNQCQNKSHYCKKIYLRHYTDLKNVTAEEVAVWVYDNFMFDIPLNLESQEDMQAVGPLMSKFGNAYSYLSFLYAQAKIMAKAAKKNGDKESYEDFISIRDTLESAVKAIQFKYNTLSRMVSVRKDEMDEQRY